jgi:hypothetical protein
MIRTPVGRVGDDNRNTRSREVALAGSATSSRREVGNDRFAAPPVEQRSRIVSNTELAGNKTKRQLRESPRAGATGGLGNGKRRAAARNRAGWGRRGGIHSDGEGIAEA